MDAIKPHEIIKVVTKTEDMEEEMYAKVLRNTGELLYVTYLVETEKLYRGACVYEFESVAHKVPYGAILEYYEGVIDLRELGVVMPQRNCFAFESEIDPEDSSSDVISDDEDDEYDPDFIDDGPIEGGINIPHDARVIDEEWNSWSPSSEGGRHFKSVVDRLEERARLEADEHNF